MRTHWDNPDELKRLVEYISGGMMPKEAAPKLNAEFWGGEPVRNSHSCDGKYRRMMEVAGNRRTNTIQLGDAERPQIQKKSIEPQPQSSPKIIFGDDAPKHDFKRTEVRGKIVPIPEEAEVDDIPGKTLTYRKHDNYGTSGLIPSLFHIPRLLGRSSIPCSYDFALYCMSDLHLGASALNYDHLVRDLEEAVNIGARIFMNGDIFDAILPKDFKRFQPSVIAPELRGEDNLLGMTIEYAFEFLKPYAHLIDVMGIGNHEGSVLSHHNLNLLTDARYGVGLIPRLNSAGGNIRYGSYTGALVYNFGEGRTFKVFYAHGKGGNAPVTKGMIDFSRVSVWVEGADVIHLAHLHTKGLLPIAKMKISDNEPLIDMHEVKCIRTGGYLNYTEDSYTQRAGMAPEPHGGCPVFVDFIGGHKRVRVLT